MCIRRKSLTPCFKFVFLFWVDITKFCDCVQQLRTVSKLSGGKILVHFTIVARLMQFESISTLVGRES